MKRLIVFAALMLAVAASARADSWTEWRTFASHNGVMLEWRTYSHPEHDTMADWRITNNSSEALYNLNIGSRFYECANGSQTFPEMENILAQELQIGASYELGQGGAGEWIRADEVKHAECPRIVEATFRNGIKWALTFSLGSPIELEKSWMEHDGGGDGRRVQVALKNAGFDPGLLDGIFGPRTRQAIKAWQSAHSFEPTGHLTQDQEDILIADSAMYREEDLVWTVACSYPAGCTEFDATSERTYNEIRDWCIAVEYMTLLDDALCPRNGTCACDFTSNVERNAVRYIIDSSGEVRELRAADNYDEIHRAVAYYRWTSETRCKSACQAEGDMYLGFQ